MKRDAKPLKNLFLTVRLNIKPKSTWLLRNSKKSKPLTMNLLNSKTKSMALTSWKNMLFLATKKLKFSLKKTVKKNKETLNFTVSILTAKIKTVYGGLKALIP